MEYRVVHKDFKELDDLSWKKFNEFRKQFHEETKPDEPFENDESYRQLLKVKFNNPEQILQLNFIEDVQSDDMVGLFIIGEISPESPSYENLKHAAFMLMDLLPKYRSKGIEYDLFNRVKNFSKDNNKRVILYAAWDPEVRQFVEDFGFDLALSSIENRVYLETIDWSMIEKWITEGRERNPTTKIKVFEHYPEEILDEYSRVLTETMNQIPRGSLDIGDMVFTPKTLKKQEEDMKAAGREHLHVITVEENDKISGITWFTYAKSKEKALGQGLTSVQENYRGRGLGKWIKAVALAEAKKKFPQAEFVATNNATSNAPMLAINEKLGFKEHKVLNNYQISTEKLDKLLEELKQTA